jgi:hypothetical protein
MAQGIVVIAKRTAKLILRSFGLEIRRAQPVGNSGLEPAPSHGSNQPFTINRLRPEAANAAWWPNRPMAFTQVFSNYGTIIINRNDYRMIRLWRWV